MGNKKTNAGNGFDPVASLLKNVAEVDISAYGEESVEKKEEDVEQVKEHVNKKEDKKDTQHTKPGTQAMFGQISLHSNTILHLKLAREIYCNAMNRKITMSEFIEIITIKGLESVSFETVKAFRSICGIKK